MSQKHLLHKAGARLENLIPVNIPGTQAPAAIITLTMAKPICGFQGPGALLPFRNQHSGNSQDKTLDQGQQKQEVPPTKQGNFFNNNIWIKVYHLLKVKTRAGIWSSTVNFYLQHPHPISECLGPVLAPLLLIQFLADAPGKVADDSPSTQVPATL